MIDWEMAARYVRKCIATGEPVRVPPCLAVPLMLAIAVMDHAEAERAATDMISEGGPV